MSIKEIFGNGKFRMRKYNRLHDWIKRERGRADHCENGCKPKSGLYQWANLSGEYKQEISDWKMLCNSCHGKLDFTETQREILRQVNYGNGNHNTKVIMIGRDGKNKEYKSIKEAVIEHDILHTSISNCLNGRSKTAGGYKWIYKTS